MDTPLPTSVDWRANIGTRFWARLLDGLILAVPVLPLTLATSDFDGTTFRTPLWVTAATALIAALYEIGFIAMTGQTIGKRVLRIQVVDVVTGRPPNLGGAAIRHLVPSVPNVVPGVGPLVGLLVYLSAVWSPTRQGWHDRAAGTVVVRT
ncbi:MAG: RDD family protein, partial [Actinomycetota bacterium]|nr:RDD family protein [Actinomycetota bacterium]